MTFNESKVELAAFTWLESLVWRVKYGPEIAPGTLEAEREDFGQALSPKPISFLWH